VDASKPNPARMYDRYLGGTANFPFSRFEWDCFLDGVRNREFDGEP